MLLVAAAVTMRRIRGRSLQQVLVGAELRCVSEATPRHLSRTLPPRCCPHLIYPSVCVRARVCSLSRHFLRRRWCRRRPCRRIPTPPAPLPFGVLVRFGTACCTLIACCRVCVRRCKMQLCPCVFHCATKKYHMHFDCAIVIKCFLCLTVWSTLMAHTLPQSLLSGSHLREASRAHAHTLTPHTSARLCHTGKWLTPQHMYSLWQCTHKSQLTSS